MPQHLAVCQVATTPNFLSVPGPLVHHIDIACDPVVGSTPLRCVILLWCATPLLLRHHHDAQPRMTPLWVPCHHDVRWRHAVMCDSVVTITPPWCVRLLYTMLLKMLPLTPMWFDVYSMQSRFGRIFFFLEGVLFRALYYYVIHRMRDRSLGSRRLWISALP